MDDHVNAPRAIDQMDTGLDFLRTAATALRADGWVDAETIEAIRNTIDKGIAALAPVRDLINEM